MAISEEVRHRIYESFRASFGDEVANGMMEMLPPVGWADVATKHDLAALEERLDLRFGALEERVDVRFAGLEERLDLRFALVDARFAQMDQRFYLVEARMGERLERALRVQSARFMTAMAAMFTAFSVIDRLILR